MIAVQKRYSNTESWVLNESRVISTIIAIMVTTDQSVVTTDQSVVTTDQSVVTTDQPVVTTDQSVVTIDQSVVTTDQPVVTTDRSVVTTDQSVVTFNIIIYREKNPKGWWTVWFSFLPSFCDCEFQAQQQNDDDKYDSQYVNYISLSKNYITLTL